jgi:hypothetical protein
MMKEQKVKKAITAISAIILLLALVPIGEAYAGPRPIEATGTINATSSPTGFKFVGPNTIMTATSHATTTGTVACTVVEQTLYVIGANGDFTGGGWQTFTGTVDGKSGSFVTRVDDRGNLVSGTLKGSNTIIGGTGDLTNLHGHFDFELTTSNGITWTGTYEGKVEFSP